MIIITGAAGFIGSALAWQLNQIGDSDLLLVDELGKTEKWKNLIGLNYQDYLEKESLLDFILSNSLPYDNITAILHMGACSATTEKDASFLVQNNFEYTKILAEYCLQKNIRFIYASSAATYGDGTLGYSDDHGRLAELKPMNMYGYSKHMFDRWAQKQGILSEITGLKFFNVYGPNEYHKDDMRSMVVKAYGQIKENGSVKLFKSHKSQFGDGEQVRDFIYIKDVVKMTLHCLKDSFPGGIYNIGTGKARTWNDMMRIIFKELNVPENIEYTSMPLVLQGKYQYHTQADMKKFMATDYLEPINTLESGVKDYIGYLQSENPYLN